MNEWLKERSCLHGGGSTVLWEELHTLCVTPTLLDHRVNISEVVGKVTSGNVCKVQRKQSMEKRFANCKVLYNIINNMLPFIEHPRLRVVEGSTGQAVSYLSDLIHTGSQDEWGYFFLHCTVRETEAKLHNVSRVTWLREVCRVLPFGFKTPMGLPCPSPARPEEKGLFHAREPSQLLPPASRGCSQAQPVPERK